ncbi:MAG TPA: 30S ribosome-binding factor RbfA [Bryobacteraceae bacterium]|nr:30S ribosome-binding factor RbfA [Bryobacteraceae bacterium]
MDERRNARVTEALREELSEMIALELADPRVEGVQLTDLHVSPDLKKAIGRLAIPQGADSKDVLEAMEHAKSFIKRELAARLDIFRIPELRFEVDLSVGADPKLQHLLKRIRKGRPRDGESSENAEKKPEA